MRALLSSRHASRRASASAVGCLHFTVIRAIKDFFFRSIVFPIEKSLILIFPQVVGPTVLLVLRHIPVTAYENTAVPLFTSLLTKTTTKSYEFRCRTLLSYWVLFFSVHVLKIFRGKIEMMLQFQPRLLSAPVSDFTIRPMPLRSLKLFVT